MIHNLSLRLAKFFAFNGGMDASRVPVIAYGLELILGLFIKLLFFLIVPSLLGVLPQTLAALSASALFRLPAGGAHCTSFGRCLIGSLLAFTTIGLLTKLTGGLGQGTMPVFYIIVGLAVVTTIYLVPLDNSSRPVKKPEERLKMKKWALGVLAGYAIVAAVLPLGQDIILAASLGLTVQLLTLLPLGHKAMYYLDYLLIKLSPHITRAGR
ncbi:accessory gene regulator ArgB-like protein [Neomoorella thermoacetica]|uniref:Accessory gene regulator protein B n=3 Tax=Neomoorella thermoacetica TaxID=1525 RepID=A0A1D7XBR0_NEOTH|nr:accessory gene regulator B family protein [Moorella thermoacetica]AKX94418.1 putative AgrB-like protein [Moorella thermoacetica]AKX97054.1 putative AgrB-like protein [Moorella thermoacetica]AOQ24357.1 Putative AgrB-like protein [Moorella thermoacetica]OIQ11696.1 putative AgrB-like protein [Moorella thermoacetica]OIQ55239.1 putative AgrB-like protein [Moorella thermoacetica]